MYPIVVITPPDAVVSLEDAKLHLRVTFADDDDLIESHIAAATEMVQDFLGRAIGVQTLEYRQDAFAGDIDLPYPDVVSIDGISYVDTGQVEQDLDSGEYDLAGARVVLAYSKAWPSTSGQPASVVVRYLAGYETVPAPIVQAIKLMVKDLYEPPKEPAHSTIGENGKPAGAAASLIARYRVFR